MSMLQLHQGFTRARGAISGFCEDWAAYGGYEDIFRLRYRHYRGRSGRSYVFSVYAPRDCPPYADAVVIVTAGRGEVLACLDLGPFPEASLSMLRRRFKPRLEEVQFQIHVLADCWSERQSLIGDLDPLEGGASRFA